MLRLFLAIILSFFITSVGAASEIDEADLRQDIADNKISGGWKGLNQVLQDANKNESDPKVRLQNKRVIDRILNQSSFPKVMEISNYNNNLKNKLNGKDFVFAKPEGQSVPTIKMDLAKIEEGKYRKAAKIDFDATYGLVGYEVTFPRKHLFKRSNAIAFSIRSSIPKVQMVLKTEEGDFTFDYQGLEDKWRKVILPFESFTDFSMDIAKKIEAFQIVMDSQEMQEENFKGTIYLDNLEFMQFKDENLEAQKKEVERYRFRPAIGLVEQLYQEREDRF